MKKLISLLAAVTMILPVGAYATITDNDDMTVNINQETEIKNAMMEVDVILPGHTYSDLLKAEKTEYLNILAYGEQVVTDEEGVIDVTFKLRNDSPSGTYTFVIVGKNYKKEIQQFILNDELSNAAMNTIGDALIGDMDDQSKINAVKAAISSQPAEYGIDKTSYAKDFTDKDWERSAKLAYEYMKSNDITSVNPTIASEIFNKAIAIVAIENKAVENVITDAKIFALDKGELSEWYEKSYVTEATGRRIAERLKAYDEKFESFEEFDKALTEAFVLSVIEDPDGAGNTKAIMQNFAKYIGTGTSGTDKRYEYVSKKVWDSYSDLQEAFDGYKETTQKNNSGGGGSSSGGRVPSTAVTTNESDKNEDKKQDEIKKYPLTIFNDLETVAWAEDAIVSLAEKGIVNGINDDMFAPDNFVTREEFSAMLVRAFVAETQVAEIGFSDVLKSEWYYDSVAKAYSVGIVKGESEDLFGIGKNITRQDMAVMLYRVGKYIGSSIPDSDEHTLFSDDEMISDYAKEAVYSLRNAEIINGVGNSEFAPFENATRAQAAKMIYGLIEL